MLKKGGAARFTFSACTGAPRLSVPCLARAESLALFRLTLRMANRHTLRPCGELNRAPPLKSSISKEQFHSSGQVGRFGSLVRQSDRAKAEAAAARWASAPYQFPSPARINLIDNKRGAARFTFSACSGAPRLSVPCLARAESLALLRLTLRMANRHTLRPCGELNRAPPLKP